MNDWQAAITTRDRLRRVASLIIYRQMAGGALVVMGPDGEQMISEGEEPPADVVFNLPWPALAAIRDAVDAELGVRESKALLDEVKDSLRIERERVDRILGAGS